MTKKQLLNPLILKKTVQIVCVFLPIIAAFLPMDQFLIIGTSTIILLILNVKQFVKSFMYSGNFIFYLFALYMGVLAQLNKNLMGLIAVFFLTLIITYNSFLRRIITKNLFESLMVVIGLGSVFSLCFCTINFYTTSTYLLYTYFMDLVPIPFEYVINIAKGIRSSSTFIQPNYYGHLSAFIALICLFYILTSTKKIYQKKRLYVLKLGFYVVILLVNLFALQLTQSRSAYIGLVVGTIILVLFFDFRLFIVVTISVAILIITKFEVLASIFPRMDSIIKDGQYRIGVYKSAIEEIKHNLFIGKGFYTYPLVYKKYQQNYEIHVHNIFLEVFMDSGLIGISILIAYYTTYIKRPIKDWVARNKEYLPLVMGVLALEAANGMTDAVLIFPQSFLFISIVLLSLELNGKPKANKVHFIKAGLDDSVLKENN